MAEDIFEDVRRKADKALRRLRVQIADRERELADLLDEAERWRAVVAEDDEGLAAQLKRGRRRARAAAGRRAGGRKRVSWDAVLASLPKVFTIDDMMKDPRARAKGRPQAYPALTRWLDGKKVKRVGKGKYRKL